MYAVSTAETRTAGRTSFDSVAAFVLGKLGFTVPLTARGIRRPMDWLATRQTVRDRDSHHPSATGHGHRP